MDEIVKDFLIESNENLDRSDREVVKLESDPASKDLLASIFRTIHTIKGSCGFLGFARLEKVAHGGENLLSRLRDGKMSLNAEVTSGLLAMVDAVRGMLSEIQSTEPDGENDYAELLANLKQMQSANGGKESAEVSLKVGANKSAAHESTASSDKKKAPAARAPEAKLIASPSIAEAAGPSGPPTIALSSATPALGANVIAAHHRPSWGTIGGLLVERGQIQPADLSFALQEQERGDRRKVGEILVSLGVCKPEDILAAQQTLESRGRESGAETVRVGVNLLDKLMNLVGELVLVRNQLLQFSNNTQDASFQAVAQRMNLIATELQEEVMKTRMQPIGNIWNKFPRTVRDLALSCGKEIRLEMVGQETELDRTIIEGIGDPLTHLVRNAVDHGVELPQARTQAGKESCGCLKLRAFHEGGQVNIEISDDGAGLSSERIRKKAIERGLVTGEQAARMSERDVINMIFLPGFSTAEEVTNVSGRGVGLDVVKTNVEKIGGIVDVQSTPGRGMSVRVKIPLTLAIVPALVVRCIGERFAIPQISLTELVRLESGKGLEMVHGVPVYRLRGQLLPLVYLSHVLQFQREAEYVAHPGGRELQNVNIVVLQAESRQFGLVVDDILDTQEIVVKPMGRQLMGLNVYSGATIMGDGRVALILDVLGLAQHAKVVAEARESVLEEKRETVREGMHAQEALLLAQNGREGRVAIPLPMVVRLEEFPATVVERAGNQEVMQYRGKIIPLVRLSSALPAGAAGELAGAATIQVVVYSEGSRTVGLVVDRILDIVEEHTAIESLAPRTGVVGSFVTQRHVTDLLDVPAIVRAAASGLESTEREARTGTL